MNDPVADSFVSPPLASGNINLFDNNIHAVTSPGSPGPLVMNAPRPLEPCPDSTLLRPFWLMRCFYQTLTHPRGGYLSTKLFIPREVWKVKNVKLKGLDEKIANCDLLTAALSKLNSVDTLDADAVLEEMQSFENVLDQAQANLSKKLGNEVGLHNISSLFKDAPASSTGIGQTNQKAGSDATSAAGINKTGSKSYLTSWRKLRSKTSSTSLSTSYTNIKEVPKEGLTMHSVPMTAVISPPIRLVKRDTESMKCEGPNANYMSTLARLCDAVQVLGKSVPCLTCA